MSIGAQRTEPREEILIVEDSRTQAQQLQRILEREGYLVTHAANGRLALEALHECRPQMVISDVMMPEMDGYELCGHIKGDHSLREIPIILVTNLSDPEDVIRGLECGADNFILKPYEERYLLSRVQFVLLNRTMHRTDHGGMAVDILFNGQKHVITADRLQILNLLLSTYDAAIQRNKELTRAREDTRRVESFLNSVIENVPDMVYVKDARDMRLVLLNHATEDAAGRPRSEMFGKTAYEFLPKADADVLTASERAALERRAPSAPIEMPFRSASRGTRLLQLTNLPIVDANDVAQYVLGIAQDITERKAHEEALAAAKLEAERANRAKSEFLSRMSHDLRTPLNAILGFAQLLEMDPLKPDQREAVRHILKGGTHLLGLINEVLDISRIESGHLSLSLEPVDIDPVLRQIAQLVQPLAAERGIPLEVDTDRTGHHHVMADRQRLNQVLLNLVSNAVKYNRSAGRVRVTCEDVSGSRLRINVTDTGPGIAPENVKRLFRPFERLGAEQTEIQGTGLGLMLSKALTEAMRGTIGVQTELGSGSTFWVEFPVADDVIPTVDIHEGLDEGLSLEASAITGALLYVEDNISNLRLMERLVARRPGVRLMHAADGQGGYDRAHADLPDLILLDLHLPDLHGEDLLRKLQDNPRTRPIPVAVLSADATPGQAERLMAAGAAAYLTKPIDVREVLRFLDDRLGGRSSS